jgi:predicted transcriptional regulator
VKKKTGCYWDIVFSTITCFRWFLRLEHKTKDFSKFPQAVVRSGLLTKLSNPAVRVYLVLLTYANYHTGLSFPTVKTLSRLSGASKNLIAKALKELVVSGLIGKFRGSKKFRYRNYYRIINMPKIDLDAIPEKTYQPQKILREQSGRFKSQKTVPCQIPSTRTTPFRHSRNPTLVRETRTRKRIINRYIY